MSIFYHHGFLVPVSFCAEHVSLRLKWQSPQINMDYIPCTGTEVLDRRVVKTWLNMVKLSNNGNKYKTYYIHQNVNKQ